MAKKPLEIDACAGSQLRDTQGEMLSVEGADISDLIAGKGRWNDNHGKGFFNSIGRITTAKKIFKAEDCEDDRQRYYWEKVKAPYIYVKGYLYSDEDHPNAKAAAAILRNIHKADAPLRLKASVEGGVISRGLSDPSLLARTKIHSVALTFTPANNATLVEPLSLDKSTYDEAADMELIKSVIHLAETNIPSFRHIARDASASKVRSNIERIAELVRDTRSINVPTKQEIIQHALEVKIKRNVEKIYKSVLELRRGSVESLEKGKKELLSMYKPEHLELGKQHVEWANKLPKNNWKEWAVKAHSDDPNAFTEEHKKSIEHFSGINHPLVRDVPLSRGMSLEQGLERLRDGEKQYIEQHKKNNHLMLPHGRREEGWSKNLTWFDTGRSYSPDEGAAMGHCGNVSGIDDNLHNILSLRKEITVNGKKYHQPQLTFVENRAGVLGEMKGRFNKKPGKEHHEDIAALLKDPHFKGIVGGGYQPEGNFEFKDLSPELQNEVLTANPKLVTDPWDQVDKALDQGLVDADAVFDNFEKIPVKHHKFLARHDNPTARASAAKSTPDPKLHELLAKDDEIYVRSHLARNPNLDPKLHGLLAKDDDSWVRSHLASNPNLDPKVHELLAKDGDLGVRSTLAHRPDLDPKVHELLAKDDKWGVRSHLARNSNLDPKLHELLAKDDFTGVRQALAHNPNLDPKLHELLAKDDEIYVRLALASNSNLDLKVHELLAKDDKREVRSHLASNPNLDPKLHELLAKDDEPEVRRALAPNPNLDPKLHELLAKDDRSGVRSELARNPNLDPKLHELLAKDDKLGVRLALAHNPNLDPKVHELLAKDGEPEVRRMLVGNKNLDSKAIRHLVDNESDPGVIGELLASQEDKLSRKEVQALRDRLVIDNPDPDFAGSETVYNEHYSPDYHERYEPEDHEKLLASLSDFGDLKKGIVQHMLHHGGKSMLIGAAMLGTSAAASPPAAPHPAASNIDGSSAVGRTESHPFASHPAAQRDLAAHQKAFNEIAVRHPLLGAIGLVESSGAQNYNHKTIKDPKSMHYGHTAGGMFGMMPHAAAYALRVSKGLRKKYPELYEASLNLGKNHRKFTEAFNSDPQAAIDFAGTLLARNKSKTKNIEMLVHSWNHGLRGTWKRYKKKGADAINNADYVKDVMEALKSLEKQPVMKAPVMKALIAGYGGAAAPGSRVGGGVIQSESLDDGRSFKYVVCDDCGKEQLYARHQVKCRECGKNWSLDKLHKIMLGKTR